MNFQENTPLAPFTTFKIGGPAKYFCEVKDQFDALEAFEFAKKHNLPTFILGGGSNLLVSDKGFNGLVIKVVNKGIEVIKESNTEVLLKAASGENWDELVKFCAGNGWWGIENLSHIPGSTGAVAVQNVGAYGQEAGNVIESVAVFDRQTGQILTLNNSDCGFAYRKSIFNGEKKGQYIIFYIYFRLSKTPKPVLSYRDMATRFSGQQPSLIEIRQAIIEIRNKKYPFPVEAKNGNAGSFFKNIVLDEAASKTLLGKVENRFGLEAKDALQKKLFVSNNGVVKVPTAALMELLVLKNLSIGGTKIKPSQPLVIINETGSATASDVLDLAKKVIGSIEKSFELRVEIEPNLLGF